MKEGKIVEQGTIEQGMQNPKHDYTKALLNSAPKLFKEKVLAAG